MAFCENKKLWLGTELNRVGGNKRRTPTLKRKRSGKESIYQFTRMLRAKGIWGRKEGKKQKSTVG